MSESFELRRPACGLIGSIGFGYRDLRESTRTRLAANPRAGEAYLWLVTAGLVIFAADLVAKALSAVAAGEVPGEPVLLEWTVSAMLGATVFVPALTALAAIPVWGILRVAFAGAASLRETFLSSAWSALLASPLLALASLSQAGIGFLRWEANWAIAAIGAVDAVALAGSLWIWSQCIASASGYRSGTRLFAGTAVPLAAGLWIGQGT